MCLFQPCCSLYFTPEQAKGHPAPRKAQALKIRPNLLIRNNISFSGDEPHCGCGGDLMLLPILSRSPHDEWCNRRGIKRKRGYSCLTQRYQCLGERLLTVCKSCGKKCFAIIYPFNSLIQLNLRKKCLQESADIS